MSIVCWDMLNVVDVMSTVQIRELMFTGVLYFDLSKKEKSEIC